MLLDQAMRKFLTPFLIVLLVVYALCTAFIWRTMRRNPHVRRGLERAGFKGGWLEIRPGVR